MSSRTANLWAQTCLVYSSLVQALLDSLQPCVLQTKGSKLRSLQSSVLRIPRPIGHRGVSQRFWTKPISKKSMVTSKTRSMQAMVCATRMLFAWSLKKQVNESWICFPSVLSLSETRRERSNWHKKVDIHQDASCMQKTLLGERLNERLQRLHENTTESQCAQTRLQSTSFNANINHRTRAFAEFGPSIKTQIKS